MHYDLPLTDKKYYDLYDCMPFGKYKNKSIYEIVEINPDYLLWCDKNMDNFSVTLEVFKKLVNNDPIIYKSIKECSKMTMKERCSILINQNKYTTIGNIWGKDKYIIKK